MDRFVIAVSTLSSQYAQANSGPCDAATTAGPRPGINSSIENPTSVSTNVLNHSLNVSHAALLAPVSFDPFDAAIVTAWISNAAATLGASAATSSVIVPSWAPVVRSKDVRVSVSSAWIGPSFAFSRSGCANQDQKARWPRPVDGSMNPGG